LNDLRPLSANMAHAMCRLIELSTNRLHGIRMPYNKNIDRKTSS
jgi:hypothetical protein